MKNLKKISRKELKSVKGGYTPGSVRACKYEFDGMIVKGCIQPEFIEIDGEIVYVNEKCGPC